MMEKVGILGVLLLTPAKSFLDCHPNVKLVKEEEDCMRNLLFHKSLKSTENISVQCSGMWDNLTCWPAAPLGETVSKLCPEFFHSEGKVQRNCTANGWTELFIPYEDACVFNVTLHFLNESPDTHLYFSSVRTVYTVGYALSLISLAIAITILCLFRKLHCTRNYIHIQLFISFILKAIFIFARDTLLFSENTYHCNSYPVGCKFVPIFSNYCILANYSWLLVEGHFLFTLVSRSFFSLKKHLIWYIVLSWGLPLILIVAWSCARYFYEDEGCWETGSHEWILWILRVPVLLSICTNLIFFLGILRVLVSKLRMPDARRNEFSQYKKLIKSTFFLVAVFGLHYMVFVFLRVEASSSMSKIKMFAELVLSSTQGLMVATLYCFMNGEVQQEFKRRWRRWKLVRRLPNRPRHHHGSISHSGSANTQVSLLPSSPGSQASSVLPVDTLEM
uniref:Secretin receptor n=1 Tax=Oryzias latipes TaxID=8090 RepID=A0A3P9LAK3_ORYLA